MLLTKESQAHGGAVTSSTPKVQYGYTDGSSNHARRTSLTSPDGSQLDYKYGYTGSADDALNRVDYLKSGTAMGVEYSYLGVDQIVICSYSCEPSVELTYFTAGQTGEAGDQYTGLDRFGRVIDQRWRKTSDNSDRERVKYGFDRLSNRKWRQQATPAASGKEQDEYYTYDGLYQVKSLQRGALTGNPPSGISSPPAWEEGWNFDPTGNWHGSEAEGFAYRIQEGGGTTLNQNRTHTVANEIETISRTTGSNWPTPSYDALGSFITTPQPLSPVNEFKLKWDAWSRLVELRLTDDSFVGAWAYDGANRRVSKLTGAEMRHYYYSDQWQVLEERTGDNAYAERRFIWGLRGVDDLVCRDRRLAGTTERLYALNDPANVTAIVDVVGTVVERYGYDGFGAVRRMDANFDPPTEASHEWETLFSSYRYDQDTGLYLPRERILHSKLGRWLSRDPIGYRAGTNLYGGMGNGPMNRLDPFGLAAPPADIAAFMEKYAQEHEGAQPWVGWWDTHQNRAFVGWYRGEDAERYGLVFNPNWANLNAPAPPEAPSLAPMVPSLDLFAPVPLELGSATRISSVAGGLVGAGVATEYALWFQSIRIDEDGQVVFGRSKRPPTGRSFHLDFPHGKFGPHINADIGPLRRFGRVPGHIELPSSRLLWLGNQNVIRWGGRLTGAAGVGLDIYNIGTAPPGHRGEAIGGAAGGLGGGILGGMILGSWFPGPGTLIGGVIGGVMGGYGGSAVGNFVENDAGRPGGALFPRAGLHEPLWGFP